MKKQKLKVGMVGVSHFGGARRNRMRNSGLYDLVAAYDTNKEALKECQEQDGAQPVESYEALLNFPDIKAIIISTGAPSHAEFALAAMRKGLHVFVEKPLCSTPDEMNELLKVQKQTGRVVCVGHNDYQNSPKAKYLKGILDSGELGKIVFVEMVMGHEGGLCQQPGAWRTEKGKNPGGPLFQEGVHAMLQLAHFFGPIKNVSCRMRYDIADTAVADMAMCQVEFNSGLLASINAFYVCPYHHYFNIYGTKANLYQTREYSDPSKLFIQRSLGAGVKARHPIVQLPMPAETDKPDDDPTMYSFYEAIVNGKPIYPSIQDGARALVPVFAAEKSADEGRVVEVPKIG